MDLQFFEDPGDFLDVAGDRLAEQPVLSTVVAGVAERIRRQDQAGVGWPAGVPRWFAAVLDAGRVVGAAMRTAPFGDYPAYVLPMPDEAVHLLTRTLLARGEPVLGANGALPAARVFCQDMATATGRSVVLGQHTRLFELGELVTPQPTSGGLRPAYAAEIPLVASWYDAFMADADEQAGREPGVSPHESPTPEELARRVATGRVCVWVDGDEPVSLVVASPPAFGVSRIGPVFTPKPRRGRGYASAGVHAVSRMLLEAGERVCLFTDQANPTSNKIYVALGYRPVVDMANLSVE